MGIEFAYGDGPPVVSRVFPGGPAERAGLKAGDRVIEVELPPKDPIEVMDMPSLRKATAEVRSGEAVIFLVDRAARRVKVIVKPAAGVQ